MMPATGSTVSTDPWRLKKKMSWAHHASAPAFETSLAPEGSHSQETRPNTPAP